MPGLLLCLAALICIGAAADSDIQLSGVTVALIEGGGSVAQSHAAASPDASKQLGTLDQTRTLKVMTGSAVVGGDGNTSVGLSRYSLKFLLT